MVWYICVWHLFTIYIYHAYTYEVQSIQVLTTSILLFPRSSSQQRYTCFISGWNQRLGGNYFQSTLCSESVLNEQRLLITRPHPGHARRNAGVHAWKPPHAWAGACSAASGVKHNHVLSCVSFAWLWGSAMECQSSWIRRRYVWGCEESNAGISTLLQLPQFRPQPVQMHTPACSHTQPESSSERQACN